MNNQLNNRGDRMANRGDRFQNGRDRWNDWHDRHYHHHDHWHHGHWPGHWGPGLRWNYWWDNYPAMAAFGLTTWAINRVGWAFGYNPYYNPYYTGSVVVDNSVYDYSQPIVMTPDEQSLAVAPDETVEPPAENQQALSAFDEAQQRFSAGDYNAALTSVDAALREMPNDTVIHEFRALVCFALGKYQESAATLYAVLSVGPGWDWTTMSSLYPEVSVYTEQLRKLENHYKTNTRDTASAFVLAYHYITCGHQDPAIQVLTHLVQLTPDDKLVSDLLQQLDPDADIQKGPELTKPPKATGNVDTGIVQGKWKAERQSGDVFELSLDESGQFNWKYSADGQSNEVKGVYAVDEDGVLALEMNDEGTMLAQLDVKGSNMDFYMLGDTSGTEPLHFQRQ